MVRSIIRSTAAAAAILAVVAAIPVGAQDADRALGWRPVDPALADLWMSSDTCNSYLLREGTDAIVFDLGSGAALPDLAAIGVQRIEWVLQTHHHREVGQGLGRLDRRATRLAVPEAERRLFEHPEEFRKWHPTLGDEFTVYGASYVRPPRSGVSVDRGLEDGDVFEWRGHRIRCVATPGHSPGGMSFLLETQGRVLAITGGLVHDGSKMTTWFDTEWDYGFAAGLDTLIASVERIAAASPDLILPEQGPLVREPKSQLATYLERLRSFRTDYVRGYPVFDSTPEQRDPLSTPTEVPLIARVTPHLYKLSHQTQGKNFAILISDRGRGLVLDCGLFPESMLDEIVLGLREHMGLKGIDAFWISHMHGDHFLLGPTLKRKYGAQAWTLDRIVDRCEHPRRYDYAALVSAYSDGFDGMKIDRALRDGEVIEWEGYRIQVDWMPGQTEFGCCLWLEVDGRRIAFTGDNLFGTPSDPEQNGHEAVVARNSAIFEEGYVRGSRYLLDLQPDIVMGSHSFVMPEPEAFLRRYHDWSRRIVDHYERLLPDDRYEYRFDPYWVSAYPYRVDFDSEDVRPVSVTVRNFRDQAQHHRIELRLPEGVTADPPVLIGSVGPRQRDTFDVTLTIDRDRVRPGVQLVTFDVTLDERHYGEWFDFLIRAGE